MMGPAACFHRYAAGASARLESPTSGTGALAGGRMFAHQIIYLAIELSSSSWVIAYRVPRNDKAKLPRLSFIVWKRATARDCLLSSPACATGWILRMTRLCVSSAALRPGGMDFGCIDF